MGGATSQTPGSQYDRSVVGEMLGDPGTLLQLLGAVIPNFYSNNMVFRPREALSTLGQMYGRTADRAALQEGIKKLPGMFPSPMTVGGQTETIQPYTGLARPINQTYLPVGTQIPAQRDYASEAKRLTGYRPPGLAASFKNLSPREQRAVMGSQSAMGTWSDVFGETRREALSDVAMQKDRLLRELLPAFEANPTDPKLQEAVLALSKEPENQAQRLGALTAFVNVFKQNLPAHERDMAPLYANYAREYGMKRMEEFNIARSQQQRIANIPGIPQTTRDFFTNAVDFARPLSESDFTKLALDATTQARVDEARRAFPQLGILLRYPSGLPMVADPNIPGMSAQETFTEMQAKGFGDVLPFFEQKQQAGVKYAKEQERLTEVHGETKRYHDLVLAGQAEARTDQATARLDRLVDRDIQREQNKFLRQQTLQQNLLSLELGAEARIKEFRGALINMENNLPMKTEPDGVTPAETVPEYVARLRARYPQYKNIEALILDASDVQQKAQTDRSLLLDPTGESLIGGDKERSHDITLKLASEISAMTQENSPRVLAVIDHQIRRLERSRGKYRAYPQIFKQWEENIYTPLLKEIHRLRYEALEKSSQTPVSPPSSGALPGISFDPLTRPRMSFDPIMP